MFRTSQIVLVPMIVVVTSALSWGIGSKLHHKPNSASDVPRKTLSPAKGKQEQFAPPLSLEQMSPPLLKVSYLDGQLTIVAENSTLADILSAVCSQTGAVIDLPPGSGSERVASRMGPGPARDVLAALLNGSRFDYVIIGSPSNSGAIKHITLIPRGNGSESTGPSDNPSVEVSLAGAQPSQRDAKEAKMTSDDVDDSGDDDSDQSTTEMTSEAQEPPEGDGEQIANNAAQQQRSTWPMPQVQQPGINPQQPANSPTTPPGTPNPQSPHN